MTGRAAIASDLTGRVHRIPCSCRRVAPSIHPNLIFGTQRRIVLEPNRFQPKMEVAEKSLPSTRQFDLRAGKLLGKNMSVEILPWTFLPTRKRPAPPSNVTRKEHPHDQQSKCSRQRHCPLRSLRLQSRRLARRAGRLHARALCRLEPAEIPDKDQAMAKIVDLTLLSDILPTGYHGCIEAGVRPGSTVYNAAAGPVGRCAAASARLLGASRSFRALCKFGSPRRRFLKMEHGNRRSWPSTLDVSPRAERVIRVAPPAVRFTLIRCRGERRDGHSTGPHRSQPRSNLDLRPAESCLRPHCASWGIRGCLTPCKDS